MGERVRTCARKRICFVPGGDDRTRLMNKSMNTCNASTFEDREGNWWDENRVGEVCERV